MVLAGGYFLLAKKLQEAAAATSHNDIANRLRDSLNDTYRGTGTWCYLIDVFGDDQSGDVIYSCEGEIKKAPYTCAAAGATIDTAQAVDVVPLTTYEPEGVAATEAGRRNSARDMKQLQAIHDGAVGLGAACSAKESATPSTASLHLVESAATMEPIVIREARADYEIKLIAPGQGSSAFYPAEVLKRDGPKVFKEGTHVYLNHPTAAEEAQRPEGDVKNLAGVLTTQAVYHESHAKGAGLYARMKVFADHGQLVEEKAAHVGMSIRAGGVAESGKTMGGKPVLKELTSAESVDVVTHAGAGGMILTEAARGAQSQQEASDMDAAEVQKLIESAVKAAQAPLIERAIRGDAREEATRILATITLPEPAKARVIEAALASIPSADGQLDKVKFAEVVNREAKAMGEFLGQVSPSGRVIGMGAAPVVDPAEATRIREAAERTHKDAVDIFATGFGMSESAAKLAAGKFGEAA